MPVVDLPLEQLKVYKPPLTRRSEELAVYPGMGHECPSLTERK